MARAEKSSRSESFLGLVRLLLDDDHGKGGLRKRRKGLTANNWQIIKRCMVEEVIIQSDRIAVCTKGYLANFWSPVKHHNAR